MKSLIYALPFLLFLGSCSSNSENKTTPEKKYAAPALSFKIQLDTLTRSHTAYMSMQEKNGKSDLLFLNTSQNAIQQYDLQTGQLLRKWMLDKEGENGVGKIQGFLFDGDSLWVANRSRLYLLNADQQVMESWKFPQGGMNPMPYFSTINPISSIHEGNTLAFSSRLAGGYNHQPLILFDKQKKDFSQALEFPSIYKESQGDWGAMNFDAFYHTYAPSQNRLLVGFSASDSILVSDGKSSKYYDASSEYFDPITAPFKDRNAVASMMPEEYTWKFMESPSYYGILHDPYRKLYYRMAWHGVKEDQKSLPIHLWDAEKSIIVLDEQFNKKGEFFLEEAKHYRQGMIGITPEGLMIARGIEVHENEDEIIFDVFQF